MQAVSNKTKDPYFPTPQTCLSDYLTFSLICKTKMWTHAHSQSNVHIQLITYMMQCLPMGLLPSPSPSVQSAEKRPAHTNT